jgi:hypothetical protein
VALPLESRPSQTQQPSLARVPAHPSSPDADDTSDDDGPDDARSDDAELLPSDAIRRRQAAPATARKSPPVLSATVVEGPADAA